MYEDADDPGRVFDLAAELDPWLSADERPAEEVELYRELSRSVDRPALEVGVGTGRIYLELVADGLAVDGLDRSREALSVLRSRAADRDLTPTVWRADATRPAVPDDRYGLVYVPARAFNHLPTLAAQRDALRAARRALAPGERLALNTFVPRFDVVASYRDPDVREMTVDGRRHRLVTTVELADELEQVARISRELYREGESKDGDGEDTDRGERGDRTDGDDDRLVGRRETPLALVSKRQFELLFETTGYDDWQVYGGFDRDPLTGSDQEMVWIAEA